jgi:hypothetical protein
MARVRAQRNWESQFLAHVGAQVKAVTEAVADDCRSECPVDSGDLLATVGTRYPGKLHGIVKAGGRGPLAHDVDYLGAVLYGTPPHWITSHGRWSLRTDEGDYLGRRVWHPGTQANPFMQRALYRKRKLGSTARVGAITSGLR